MLYFENAMNLQGRQEDDVTQPQQTAELAVSNKGRFDTSNIHVHV